MKLLFIVGLLSTIAVFSHAEPQCHMSELATCVDIAITWLHSLPKRSIPETLDDVNVMCTEIGKALDCGNKYRESCTTPLQKELIGLAGEGFMEMRREFCKQGSPIQNKYLAHSVCLNKVAHLDEVKDHFEYMLAVMEQSSKVPMEKRLAFECCGFSKFVNGFAKSIEGTCGIEAVNAAGELLEVIVAQLPSVVCSGFDSNDAQCKAVLPPEGSKPTEAANSNAIFRAIRDVLKNFLD